MSVFRPAARVTGPNGQSWEIYAYKLKVGDRADWDTDVVSMPPSGGSGSVDIAILNAIAWLVMLVPRLLVRLLDVAVAAIRAVRSDEWTVEAITWVPQKQSYVWTTTSEHRGQVLAQVEGSLARGDVPIHLRNGTYLGWRRSAR